MSETTKRCPDCGAALRFWGCDGIAGHCVNEACETFAVPSSPPEGPIE